MSVLISAVIVLVALIGFTAAVVGLAEFSGRLYEHKRARVLVGSLEEMLLSAVVERGR